MSTMKSAIAQAKLYKHKRNQLALWITKLDVWMPDKCCQEAIEVSRVREAIKTYVRYLANE